jgi:PAS domain S-box-containing protein
MSEDRKKAMSATGNGSQSAAHADHPDPIVQELRDARRAALNLMEDALLDRQRAERLNARLLLEMDERVRAEQAVRESEERFRLLANTAPALIWLDDPDGNCLYVNQRYLDFSGKAADELEGKGWHLLLHEDDAEEYLNTFREATREKRAFHKMARVRRHDGEWRWIESFAQPLFDDSETFIGYVGISPDITERLRAEREQRRSEERLRLLTDSFTDFAIFSLDTRGVVQTWNPGARNLFGFGEWEIIGQRGDILFVPEDQAADIPEREMANAREKGRASDERWHLRKDGSRFFASGIMVPLYDEGVLVGYAKIARDLTERKREAEELQRQRDALESIVAGRTAELAEANEALREQMEELQRVEKERFSLLQRIVTTQEDERRRIARDMHDSLGQQLTALRLKLASVKSDSFGNGRLGVELEALQAMGQRIDSEVNFLVWELRPTALDDLGLVAAIETYTREWARHSGITAEFHAGRLGKERLEPNVETNLYRITQEALNNVFKHSKAKNANLVLESRRNEIVLVIEDDGIGFDSEATRKTGSDRGLGLLGMRERAAIIGGTVEIESSPGKGTTVFARVPLEQPGSTRREDGRPDENIAS